MSGSKDGTCGVCGTSEYYGNGQCKKCGRARSKSWRHNNPEKAKLNSRKGNRRGWAPGEHQKAEALRPLANHCECCGSADPRHVRGWNADHDHSTGVFRGFLCHPCNIAVSHVEKFGLDRGTQITSYLAGVRT